MFAIRRSLVLLLVIAASCARTPASSGSDIEPLVVTPRVARNPDVISREELQDPMFAGMDALKAIRMLRPAFFRPTAPLSFMNDRAGILQISYDFGPLQPVANLVASNTMSFVEVRYLNPNEAQNRFGLNANGGPVIVLLTTKQ